MRKRYAGATGPPRLRPAPAWRPRAGHHPPGIRQTQSRPRRRFSPTGPTIVGPKLAAITVPRRLDRRRADHCLRRPGGDGPAHLSGELINRINTHLGGQPVHSLRFTQAGMPRQPPPAAPPPPEAAAGAEAAVAGLPDGELRAALASLGRVGVGRKPALDTPPEDSCKYQI